MELLGHPSPFHYGAFYIFLMVAFIVGYLWGYIICKKTSCNRQ
ncbi:MAG: hypothetical protein S4CHLAM102_05380 [Chlamydiia bacterium]|nr:hypothetical protein [Chlamydiia bacterium]